MKTICVFAGARGGDRFIESAYLLGAELTQRNATVVFGGGKNGIMGALANGVHDAGSRAVGIMPRKIADMGLEHPRADTIITSGMSDRKRYFWEQCDAYVALPGGVGTLDELFEVMANQKLKYHDKRISVCNVGGFFDPLLMMFETMAHDGIFNMGRLANFAVHETVYQSIDFVLG